MVALRLQVLEFLVGERDVTALFDLEAAHQFGPIDDLVVGGAIDSLLDPALVLFMQQVKAYGFGTGGGEQADRNRNQSKRDHSGRNRSCWHEKPPAVPIEIV
jgi:hypothetical protein